MIKKIRLIIFFIVAILIYSAGLESIGIGSAKRRSLSSNMRFFVTNTGDSLLTVSPDSLLTYLRNNGIIDSVSLSDSLDALYARHYLTLDSFNTAIRLVISDSTQAAIDSARQVLTDAKAYAEQVWIDSSSQPVVVIPNTLKNENNINIDATNDNLMKFGAVGDGTANVWLFGEDKSDDNSLKIDYYDEFSDDLYIARFNQDYSTDLYALNVDTDILALETVQGASVYEEKEQFNSGTTQFKNEWVRIAEAEDLSESNFAQFSLEWAGDWLNDTPLPPGGYVRFGGNVQFFVSVDIGDTSAVQITMPLCSFMEPYDYRLVQKIRVITKDRTSQNDSSPAYLEIYVIGGEEHHYSLTKHASQDWNVLSTFIASPGIPAGYSAYEVTTANSFSVNNYDSSFEIDYNSQVKAPQINITDTTKTPLRFLGYNDRVIGSIFSYPSIGGYKGLEISNAYYNGSDWYKDSPGRPFCLFLNENDSNYGFWSGNYQASAGAVSGWNEVGNIDLVTGDAQFDGTIKADSMEIAGNAYYKKIINKYYRADTFTPPTTDTWYNVPIYLDGSPYNTWHYCVCDNYDTVLVNNRAQWNKIRVKLNVRYANNVEDSLHLRLVKYPAGGGTPAYSREGQYASFLSKNTGNFETIPLSNGGFWNVGDTIRVEMKVGNTDIYLFPIDGFHNPNSATLRVEYAGDN